MNNYLLHLLKEVKTIIIPGLGALTVTNEQSGEIMFMPYLKYDDGTLAKHIADKEGMDLNDSKNLIAKFVREVSAELDKGEKYTMYQFGTFFKIDGDIAFEQWSNDSSNASESAFEAYGTETKSPLQPEILPEAVVAPITTSEVTIEEEPETATDVVIQESTDAIADEISTEVNEFAEIRTTTESSREHQEPLAAAVIEPEPTVIETENNSPKSTEPDVPVAVIESIEAQPSAKNTSDQKEKQKASLSTEKKKNKEPKVSKPKRKTGIGTYILWGVVVVILGAGTFVAVNFNALKKDFPMLAELAGDSSEKSENDSLATKTLKAEEPVNDAAVNAEPEPIPTESIQESEAVSTPVEPAPEVVSKPTQKPKPVRSSSSSFGKIDTSLPYHIIAGSFSSETNARNLAMNLRNKGMSDVTIGEQNGMFRVSIKGFANREEAIAAMSGIKPNVPKAWIIKWTE
jgi:cell division septation protein DedD